MKSTKRFVTGVEISAGLALLSSECNDEITPEGFVTNRCGSILAGISNGYKIVVRAAVKPISSIEKAKEP
jgi:chorismate synthase